MTGDDAGIALAWAGGGSVRLDRDSAVEFRDDNTVFLRSGQIYFDSTPSTLVAGTSVGTPTKIALLRYDSAGNLDTSFGEGGSVNRRRFLRGETLAVDCPVIVVVGAGGFV